MQGQEGFGAYLRRLMKERKLTLQALGKAAGVHYSLVARVISGERRPTPRFVRRVAPCLGVSEAELLLRAGHARDAATAAQMHTIAPYIEYARTTAGEEEIATRLEASLRRVGRAEAQGRLAALVQGVRDLADRFRSTATPAAHRMLAGGALLYFIAAIDAVPDFIPGVGLLDDLSVVTLVWALVTGARGKGGAAADA